MSLDFVLYTCFYFIVRFPCYISFMFRLFDSNKLDLRLNVTDTERFVFLGSGMYHSTELFCDYVPDK